MDEVTVRRGLTDGEHQGFTAVGGGALGMLSGLYGFDRYTTMEREVA